MPHRECDICNIKPRRTFFPRGFLIYFIMKILINNNPVDTSARSLADLAMEQGWPERGVAVAIEGRVVPRAAWADTRMAEEMQIMVIKAVCGG